MRWLIMIVAFFGLVVASLALRERNNKGLSPCKINETWDCGEVNRSQYAVIGPVPVAVIGICGYVLLGALAWRKAWVILFPTAAAGLAFSLYLTHIEASVLQVWCIYCVISLACISLITALALGMFVWRLARKKQAPAGNQQLT